MSKKFREQIDQGYTFEGDSIPLGGAMLNGECQTNCFIKLPLMTLNRHGLISGATGTGKSKTLQIIAEQLSKNGVPVLLMDVKGDLSGIAKASPGHPKIDERHKQIGMDFTPHGSPVEFLSISEEPGVRLRATATEFGPILLAKILGLNDLQRGVLAVVFKYCDDNQIPLVDLDDLKDVLQYLSDEGKEEVEDEYGRISTASVGAIIRRLVELEQQGSEQFFGEPSFNVKDLLRKTEAGEGMINILRVTDIQAKPKLFSTFMLQMLAEIYDKMPEEGDLPKPKFVMFIDEAHLLFEEASDVLLDQIKATIKLIRSKGIGIFFVTQNPTDIPEEVLSQLGLKVQHALRAFTAKDRKAIRMVAQNYPLTEYYDIEQEITDLGIGEALVTVLNEDGRPTPLARTLLRAPESRMDILSEQEISEIISRSALIPQYQEAIDKKSAEEILQSKISTAQSDEKQQELQTANQKAKEETDGAGFSWLDTFKDAMDSTAGRQVSRTIAREVTRGLMGILGGKK
ncbi:helicase HerA-like domain-containing protein [Fodinibius salsisoli]|uniref:DUF853 family protein n=1 Tax=Fodinibius salsisoli TaxID=2820877 RepID=A0ABT3PN98_9BACT|nr:helicase HerA-like domain-containing protein [Fodinibius salsisoli]MCW9707350.1 DUF853 family protein [Fodinibius salsisoli]